MSHYISFINLSYGTDEILKIINEEIKRNGIDKKLIDRIYLEKTSNKTINIKVITNWKIIKHITLLFHLIIAPKIKAVFNNEYTIVFESRTSCEII